MQLVCRLPKPCCKWLAVVHLRALLFQTSAGMLSIPVALLLDMVLMAAFNSAMLNGSVLIGSVLLVITFTGAWLITGGWPNSSSKCCFHLSSLPDGLLAFKTPLLLFFPFSDLIYNFPSQVRLILSLCSCDFQSLFSNVSFLTLLVKHPSVLVLHHYKQLDHLLCKWQILWYVYMHLWAFPAYL